MLSALVAIALWASLATLSTSLPRVPPFLLTGVALFIGGVAGIPLLVRERAWRVQPRVLALGVYGLFAYHFLLFLAFHHAPAVEANLVNYLWPLFIVVLTPLFVRGASLHATHIVAALMGFAGAAIAIVGSRTSGTTGETWGFLPALCAALVWSTYSLACRRVEFPTATIGLFGVVSGALALACHAIWEAPLTLTTHEWTFLALAGLGPLGAAFWFWNAAMKRGDPRRIGILSYATPLLSTTMLLIATHRPLTPSIALAALLILSAAAIGAR